VNKPFFLRNGPAGRAGEGVCVNIPTREALLSDIRTRWQAGQGFSVATLNLDHMVKLRRDPAFLKAYQAHSHVVADGNPIVWLSRIAGNPVSLVPGSELVTPISALAAAEDIPIALLGSSPEALKRASEHLQATHPGLRIVAQISPGYGFDPDSAEADTCIDKLRAAGARLCFVALSAPKQERFAIRAANALPALGLVSVGAGLDFIAGEQRRAPAWIRALALEWIWRLMSDPARLARRYWDCIIIFPGLAAAAARQRRITSGDAQKP